MKYLFIFLALFIVLLPHSTFAACSSEGFTVVYMNGILTSKTAAENDRNNLKKKYEDRTGRTDVQFINGYNESHIGGAGDLIESASQLLGASVSNYDRDTILNEIYPQITTRKVLLVGHSQGTFYANEIYNYLLAHGEPKGSLSVYNLATPASFVAGGGNYLTSENDKIVNAVRDAAAKIGASQPLPANISIPLSPEETAKPFGGHSFSNVYLLNAASRIVSEISDALNKLTAIEISGLNNGGCFIPPNKDISYYAQKTFFTTLDTIAAGVLAANKSVSAVGETASQATFSVYANLSSLLSSNQNLTSPVDNFGGSNPNFGSSNFNGQNNPVPPIVLPIENVNQVISGIAVTSDNPPAGGPVSANPPVNSTVLSSSVNVPPPAVAGSVILTSNTGYVYSSNRYPGSTDAPSPPPVAEPPPVEIVVVEEVITALSDATSTDENASSTATSTETMATSTEPIATSTETTATSTDATSTDPVATSTEPLATSTPTSTAPTGGNVILERRYGGLQFAFGYPSNTYAQGLPMKLGQRFILPNDSTLSKITVRLGIFGNRNSVYADTARLKIVTDSNNYPFGDTVAVATNEVFPADMPGGSTAEFDYIFSNVNLTAGTKYWIVFERTGDASWDAVYGLEAGHGKSPEADLIRSSWAPGVWLSNWPAYTFYFVLYD